MNPASLVQLGFFAKHWTPGKAKTRLAATIGLESAAAAAERFVATTGERLATIAVDRLLAFTPEEHADAFGELDCVTAGGWRLAVQPNGVPLGERMAWYFRSAFAVGYQAAVLVGSDSPDMPLDAVRTAIEWLSRPDGPADRMVFGPTSDGGYWLIGARGDLGPVFGNMPWSQPDLMSETIRALEDAGWRRGRAYELVDQWYDVDTGDDLAALCDRIETNPVAEPALARLTVDARRWLAGRP